MTSIFYDDKHRRLVFVSEEANQEYWDEHWSNALSKSLSNPAKNSFYVGLTKKYLRPGSIVLEGGCGKADKVFALSRAGFKAIGVDFAEKTVSEINRVLPSLDIRVGDVRALDLSDSSVDGYWSLGVIEHFYTGYQDIVKEMYRVLRVEGYLFLTFPSISNYRANQIVNKHYKQWSGDMADKFYQFAFSDENVAKVFESYGFSLVEKRYTGNLKGLKSHASLGFIARLVSRLPGPIASGVSRMLDFLLKNRYSHMTLLVLKKSV